DGSALDQKLSLYPGSVTQANLSIAVTQAGGAQVQTSAADADQLSVELSFPRGLLKYLADGTRDIQEVLIAIEFRQVGSSTWLGIGDAYSVVATVDFDGADFDSIVASSGGI